MRCPMPETHRGEIVVPTGGLTEVLKKQQVPVRTSKIPDCCRTRAWGGSPG